jgi:hypothetical protein
MPRERVTVGGWLWRMLWIPSVTLILTALLFEIYLRSTGFLESQPANYPCVTSDAVLNHLFLPGCSATARGEELKTDGDARYEVNRLGFRGPEPTPVSRDKRGMGHRVLLLGDSYTEGFGLSENETMAAQLQQNFAQQKKSRWEFWNGGTLGFSPTIYTLYFDRFFLEHRPSFVLLNLDFSDLNDNAYYLEIADYDALGFPVAFPPRDSFPKFALPYVYSNKSAVMRFLHQEWNQWAAIERRHEIAAKMNRLVEGPPLISKEELQSFGQAHCHKPYEWMARSILRLRDRAGIVGAKFGIHMYPPGAAVRSRESAPQGMSFVRAWDQRNRQDFSWVCGATTDFPKIMERFAERNGIYFHSSFPLILAHPQKESLYFTKDDHWNAEGVRLVSQELAKVLARWVGGGRL